MTEATYMIESVFAPTQFAQAMTTSSVSSTAVIAGGGKDTLTIVVVAILILLLLAAATYILMEVDNQPHFVVQDQTPDT